MFCLLVDGAIFYDDDVYFSAIIIRSVMDCFIVLAYYTILNMDKVIDSICLRTEQKNSPKPLQHKDFQKIGTA